MELFLLKIVALVRPLASMQYAEQLFNVLGIGLFAAIVFALFVHGSVRKKIRLSVIDGAIIAFTVWCISISLIYYEVVLVGDIAKLLIPLLTFTITKNIVSDQGEYRKLLFWMIVGFSVPAVISAVLIMAESPTALDVVNYWTQIARWQGIYTHSHNLGLSMALFLMTIMLFVIIRKEEVQGVPQRPRMFENTTLLLLGLIAVYCLLMSQVRTALLSILTFLAVYSYGMNKKIFVTGAGVLTVVAIAAAPYWLTAFNPELGGLNQGKELSVLDVGSGRPRMWLNDIMVFVELPIDQKLAGVGIGAGEVTSVGEILYGHNDWLGILTQTGLVGLAMVVFLQIAILRAILRLYGSERHAFLALFAAGNVMMLVSNGLIWRIQVSQLFFMLLAYIEIPRRRDQKDNSTVSGVISTTT